MCNKISESKMYGATIKIIVIMFKLSFSYCNVIVLRNSGVRGNCFNPLNVESNPICHLLALLGGATIVVVSRLRVKGIGLTRVLPKERKSIAIGTFIKRSLSLESQYVKFVKNCVAAESVRYACYCAVSGNLIPELLDTAYSCVRHGPVTAWFGSARSGNIIPVPKTYSLLGSRSAFSVAMELLLRGMETIT